MMSYRRVCPDDSPSSLPPASSSSPWLAPTCSPSALDPDAEPVSHGRLVEGPRRERPPHAVRSGSPQPRSCCSRVSSPGEFAPSFSQSCNQILEVLDDTGLLCVGRPSRQLPDAENTAPRAGIQAYPITVQLHSALSFSLAYRPSHEGKPPVASNPPRNSAFRFSIACKWLRPPA